MRMSPHAVKPVFHLLLFLLAWGAHYTVAASMNNDNTESDVEHGLYFGVGTFGIDEDKAYEQGVDDSGIILDMGYVGNVGEHFAFLAGISIPIIDDEDPFSQLVEDEWDGDLSYASSDISAWGFIFEASGRMPLNNSVALGGAVGLRTLSADREITGCSNCPSEDVDLDGGTYIRPYIKVGSGSFTFEFSYINFFSGDFTNGPLVNFMWSIW